MKNAILPVKMVHKIQHLFSRENFFNINVLFLIILLLNPNNKILIIASFVYLISISFIFRSLSKGLIFSFLLFNLFLVGKTYEILLIPSTQLSYGSNITGFQGYYQYITIGPKFLIGLVMFLWFGISFIKKRVRIDIPLLLLIMFVILSFISSLLSLNPELSFFYWLNILFLLPFYYYLKKHLTEDKKFAGECLRFFIIFTIYEGLWVIFQYLKKGPIFPSLEFISYIPFDTMDMEKEWFRPWGTLSHPNTLANFLLPFTILFFLSGYSKIFSKMKYLILGLIFGLLGIILSLSRSVWISLFIISSIFVPIFEKKYKIDYNPKYKKRLLTILLFLIPFAFILIIPRIEKSILTLSSGGSGYSRIELIQESLNLISKFPLFGVGSGMSVLGMFLENPKGPMYYFPTVPHNIYLHLAMELGIPTVILFFLFLFILIKAPTRKTYEIKNAISKKIVLASFICLLFNGIFQPIYSTTMLYLIIFAVLYHAI